MIGFLAGNFWWVAGLLLMAAAIAAPAVLWKFRWPAAVLVLSLLSGVQYLHANDLQQQIAQSEQDAAEDALKRFNAQRIIEQAHAKNLADIAARAAQEINDAQYQIDTLRDRVRVGDIKLRARFQCPAADRASSATADAAGAAGETPTGFTREDAAVALGLAAEGDNAIRERNLAIAVAEEYRAACAALTMAGEAQP